METAQHLQEKQVLARKLAEKPESTGYKTEENDSIF